MSSRAITPPFPVFNDADGTPLENGYIYVGVENLDPVANPLPIYWDEALTITASQPVRTLNGYPSRAGSPAQFFADSRYSILVKNKSSVAVYSSTSSTSTLADDLLSSDSGKGDALITVQKTGGSATTDHRFHENRVFNVMTDFDVKGDGVTDDYVELQKAADAARAAGGGLLWFPEPSVFYLCNTPLYVWDGVSLAGPGRFVARIVKDSTTTKAVTVTAGALVLYGGASLPANINAVVILDGPGGRYHGSIHGMGIESTLAAPGDYETQKAEFGVVSIGSLSDFSFTENRIFQTQYSLVMPTVFASHIVNNRYENCLRGPAMEDGTSLLYTSNYPNNCRDWGHFIRGMKYSQFTANACDHLNDPAKYPTRTLTCAAYRLNSLVGCVVEGNGDEQTWGRSYQLETLDNTSVKNNATLGLGSDYTGADEIAWIYSDGVMRCCAVEDNIAYGVKAGGLTYGGANAAKHHNVYFAATAFFNNSTFHNNMARASISGAPVEAGWGNNVPTTWVNAVHGGDLVQTFSPTITANTVGDLNITYNAGNKHYFRKVGNLYHIFGVFDVTITYTTAGSYLIFQGFPANQAILWRIPITGVGGGGSLVKKLAGFDLNSGGGDGIGYDETDNAFYITDIPTGSTVRIFYDGWYAKA